MSAHWERPQPTVLANPSPELYFDYYGFPDETYQYGDTPESKQFDRWLESVCVADIDEGDRETQLVDWESAPAARFCHPGEEHLVPLHVCYGIAGTAATRSFTGQVVNTTVARYSWA